MKRDDTQKEEKYMYPIWVLNGIKYLPHYLNTSVFVGPGYRDGGVAYSPEYLKSKGAIEILEPLWKRANIGQVVKNVLR
mgnify:CR=1 FL=1